MANALRHRRKEVLLELDGKAEPYRTEGGKAAYTAPGRHPVANAPGSDFFSMNPGT